MAERGPSENLLCKNDQILSVNANPLDLLDQSLLLDMIILGTHQLPGGVNIFFFYKVSFEKHPNIHVSLKLCVRKNFPFTRSQLERSKAALQEIESALQ